MAIEWALFPPRKFAEQKAIPPRNRQENRNLNKDQKRMAQFGASREGDENFAQRENVPAFDEWPEASIELWR